VLFRTLADAHNAANPPPSWIHRVFVPVTLADGRRFVRAYEFNSTRHKCKRCRHATGHRRRGRFPTTRVRVPCSGHICETCGNPFASFARSFVYRDESGRWQDNPHAVGGGERLH
jgi:hypothetical protein